MKHETNKMLKMLKYSADRQFIDRQQELAVWLELESVHEWKRLCTKNTTQDHSKKGSILYDMQLFASDASHKLSREENS